MNSPSRLSFKWLFFIPLVLLLTSCTAGGEQFTTETPAGFWYGLWHGIIAFISLIIHLFNDAVMVYEKIIQAAGTILDSCLGSFLSGVVAPMLVVNRPHKRSVIRNGKKSVKRLRKKSCAS
jgi:hypothetical protein